MTMTSPHSASDNRQSRGFDLLADPVQRWIWRKGWDTLRDIQERAIPHLIRGESDVIVAASTASGKTEAAFLPLISRIHEAPKGKGFDLVYVGPLRALINDQFGRLDDLCETLEMPVHPWHGDIGQSVKARARKNPGGILLITPESLEAMFVLRGAEVPSMFAYTHAIVIDELHALLDSERGIHLRSLLTRLELSVGRRIRRVGLSATLGDMRLVNAYLRPEAPDKVVQLVSGSGGQELRIQLRGYVSQKPDEQHDPEKNQSNDRILPEDSAVREVGKHLFDKLRGSNNLVFAGSRNSVEVYSDLLRRMSEDSMVPNEFFPHHASLSREHRDFVEQKLKQGNLPVTAFCTSTLELGIDIGDVECVGQIGAPWSVAALRQRLGRSGRRAGQPAVLRMYAIESDVTGHSHPVDTLHLRLVRSIAMVDLLIEGWCEPPRSEALHLSTLTHQILSVIAERGGASAQRLYSTLCERGPFRSVSQPLFASLLRRIGDPDIALIEQAADGTILPGRAGERMVEHYSFFAVFQTPREFRVVHGARTIGTLPMIVPLAPDLTIIFAGMRWRIEVVRDQDRVIEVEPDFSGKPPVFGGDAGDIHETVIRRMRRVLQEDVLPPYLDRTAATLLESARAAYERLDFEAAPVQPIGSNRFLLAPWTGTAGTSALAIVLASLGYRVDTFDGLVEISATELDVSRLLRGLEDLASGRLDLQRLVAGARALEHEKFHRYLGKDLLVADALSSRLDLDAVQSIARRLCAGSSANPDQ